MKIRCFVAVVIRWHFFFRSSSLVLFQISFHHLSPIFLFVVMPIVKAPNSSILYMLHPKKTPNFLATVQNPVPSWNCYNQPEVVVDLPKADLSVSPDVAKGEASLASLSAVVPKVQIGQSQMPAMAFGVGSTWLKTNDPEATKKFKGWMMKTLKKKVCNAHHFG